jgi:hypothetical protein
MKNIYILKYQIVHQFKYIVTLLASTAVTFIGMAGIIDKIWFVYKLLTDDCQKNVKLAMCLYFPLLNYWIPSSYGTTALMQTPQDQHIYIS